MRTTRRNRRFRSPSVNRQRQRRQRNVSGRVGKGRYIFNGILWTTSMIMILTLLPAESSAAKKLSDLTSDNSVLAAAVGRLSDFGDTGAEKAKDSEAEEEQNAEQTEKNGTDNSGETGKAKLDIVLTDYKESDQTSGDSASNQQAEAQNANLVSGTNSTNASDKKGSGNIIIYHTHATESYLPVAASNAHTTELKSTVREAAETLSAQLKYHGYSVVHDMTLHDYPSYNKSYNRSLETVKKLCSSYSNKKMVIDFHRDAATSNGKAKTATINGEKVAAFCLVVGTQNDNYAKIRAFADKITAKANEMYPGFAKAVVEKPYKFNEYVSDSYILLEVGNNANTIDEVNAAMPYLANVFTEVLV